MAVKKTDSNYQTAIKTYTGLVNSAPVYNESNNTKSAYSQWQDYEKNNKPGEYTGTWADTLNESVQKYLSQDPYRYVSQNDSAYQQLKDQYTRNGQKAMQDTIGQATALTGGYGSTYAQSAGQQQYNSYMGELADKQIQLEENAYNRYLNDQQQQLNQINTLQTMDNTEYSRYQDSINNYNNFLNYLMNKYTTMSGIDKSTFDAEFNVWQQQVGAQSNLASMAQSDYQFEATQAQNDSQFKATQAQNDKQFNTTNEINKKNTAYSNALTLISSGVMPDSGTLADAGISKSAAQNMIKQAKANTATSSIISNSSGSSSGSSGSTKSSSESTGNSKLTTTQMRQLAKSNPQALKQYFKQQGYGNEEATKKVNSYIKQSGGKTEIFTLDDAKSKIHTYMIGEKKSDPIHAKKIVASYINSFLKNGQITQKQANKLSKYYKLEG